MVDGAEAREQREPERAGEAERVKERQHADESRPSAVIANDLARCESTFARTFAVRQHHALRRPGAAAREDDRGQSTSAVRSPAVAADQQPRRQQARDDERAQLSRAA